MQVLPVRVQKLWNEWELRVLVLLSLSLQVVLIILGNKRKHIFLPWIRIVVWLTYMSADWVAAVSIGILANNQGDLNGKIVDPKQSMVAFWAPFLLLHLGGPDTITAYSLEDNELWLRHMLGLAVHVGLAFYVFLKSWARTPFNFLSIPMFVAGILKYGERTWVLRSTSKKNFNDSLLLASDPKANYVGRENDISLEEQKQVEDARNKKISTPQEKYGEAYFLYKNQFRRLYANLNLSSAEKKYSSQIIMGMQFKEAFEVVAMELSFMYDELYTKATLIHSLPGVLLRCTTFFSIISTLVAFCFFIDKHECSNIDIGITYSLLLGAFCLEIYAFIMFILSDWSIVWFSKKKISIVPFITSFRSAVVSDKKWSAYMLQKNLIEYCIKGIQHGEGHMLADWHNFFEQHWYTTEVGKEVRGEVKESIFCYLQDVIKNESDLKALLRHRGGYTITKMGKMEEFGWSIGSLELDRSILLWHIATDLYAHDKVNDVSALQVSKHLSEYMFNLLVMCPFMMPKWIGIEECRFRYTCAHAKLLFRIAKIHQTRDRDQAYKLLLKPQTKNQAESKSMLFDAYILVQKLTSWEESEEKKWEMIRGVWVEMLCYAASHCEWTQHAQQLRKGGEFLTHVYLLMSHLGFTQQLQMFQDQLQDARVIASYAARAAAADAREAASSACKLANVPEVASNTTVKSLYATAAHAYIVAAYADSIADAAIDTARADACFIDIGAFFTATHACDAAKHIVSNINRTVEATRVVDAATRVADAATRVVDAATRVADAATRVVDAAHAAMKQSAMAIAQIQVRMNPDSQPTNVAADDAHEASRAAKEAAKLIRDKFSTDATATTIAENVDIVSIHTDAVAKHADAAASAANEFNKAANATASALLSEVTIKIDEVVMAAPTATLSDAANQIDKVANDAPAVLDKLFALCEVADAVSALVTSTASDSYHQVNAATARAVGAARLAWKAAAIFIAKAQIKRNDQDPRFAASYVAQVAAHNVREAAFATHIAAYNVHSVAADIAKEIAKEIARYADDATIRARVVADQFEDAARTHDVNSLASLAYAMDDDIAAIDQAAHAVAATAHRFPTDATADFYHRVTVTTASLADATRAAQKAILKAIAAIRGI